MPLIGRGVLAIWNGIEAQAEADFVAWHVREHIPERVGLPGFQRGRRYVALRGHPKYFNFYETDDVDSLTSPAYVERLNNPSPWTRRVVAHFTDTSRTICRVAGSFGAGDGAAILTARFSISGDAERFAASMSQTLFPKFHAVDTVVGVHLLQGAPGLSDQQTAEKKLRASQDEAASWILLIEAIDLASLTNQQGNSMFEDSLRSTGAETINSGIYGLQFALSASQLKTLK